MLRRTTAGKQCHPDHDDNRSTDEETHLEDDGGSHLSDEPQDSGTPPLCLGEVLHWRRKSRDKMAPEGGSSLAGHKLMVHPK